MQPTRILLFLISVFLILGVVALLFPEQGIRLSDNFSLRFFTLRTLIGIDEIDTPEFASVSAAPLPQTSIAIANRTKYHIDLNDSSRLIYPNDDKSVLYPLFEELTRASQASRPIRILHYGDSQIEEDRITSTIRRELQRHFGGAGVGLVSAKPLTHSLSISHSWSDNWQRYAVFGDSSKPTHNRFGIMGAYCNYQDAQASLSFQRKKSAATALNITRVSVLYGSAKSSVKVSLSGRTFHGEKTLQRGKRFGKVEWELSHAEEPLRLKFTGISPDIYAITLDGKNGVAVDNIPIRGSSGVEFIKIDSALFAESIKAMRVKAVIFQFGGNAVPHIKSQQDLEWYETQLIKQFRLFKSLGLHLIVIGPSDMSTKLKEKFVTYAYLPDVRDMMLRTTHYFGGVYWDMYAAMGGRNSMPKWVKQKLAIEDYTHFTREGAEKIAQMFISSFMKDYREYQHATQQKSHSTDAKTAHSVPSLR
jgi:hypothetical protein